MSSRLKVLVVLALVASMTAYVAGSLMSSGAHRPADRRPVIIDDASFPIETVPAPDSPSPARTRDDGGPGGDGLDDHAQVVTPPPAPVGGDDWGDDDGDDGDDDDGGPEGDDDDDGGPGDD